jgi:hypothetical protein
VAYRRSVQIGATIGVVFIGTLTGWLIGSRYSAVGDPAYAKLTAPLTIVAIDFGGEAPSFILCNSGPPLAVFWHGDYVSIQVDSEGKWVSVAEYDRNFDVEFSRADSASWHLLTRGSATCLGLPLSGKVRDQIRRTGKVRLSFRASTVPLPKQWPSQVEPTPFTSGSEWIEAKVVVCTP